MQEINEISDDTGISCDRKCMIRSDLSKDIDGVWKKEQLSSNLQHIINKYLARFSVADLSFYSVLVQTEGDTE